MEAKELRIGNLVRDFSGRETTVEGIRPNIGKVETDKMDEDIDLLKPIPLTEEWLLKFGFEKYEFDHKENQYRFKERLLVIRKGFFCDYGTSVELKHVHQLQNLYHALTGEELKIN